MYTKTIPYKDLYDKPRNLTANFMLLERDVFKMLSELQFMFKWREKMGGEFRELPTEDVVEFYNNLEAIILGSYGEPGDDGSSFSHDGKYKFEDHLAFNALMVEFLIDTKEANNFMDQIMPKGMEEFVKKADANLVEQAKNADNPAQLAEVQRLQQELAALKGETPPAVS